MSYDEVMRELQVKARNERINADCFRSKIKFEDVKTELLDHFSKGRVKPSYIRYKSTYKYFWRLLGY